MKKAKNTVLILLALIAANFSPLAGQGVQTPTEKVSIGLSWPQVTTALLVAAMSFAGIIMWQWIRRGR